MGFGAPSCFLCDPTEILIKGEFAYFLGGPLEYRNKPVIKITIKPQEEFFMSRSVRFADFYPSTIFIYADFIEKTVVAGKELRLLRIVPIDYSQALSDSSPVMTIEFKSLEFHPIQAEYLSKMEFQLRSQTGALVPFALTRIPVLFNLLLSQQKK